MYDIETFLAGVGESRRLAQIAARAGFVAPPDLPLPSALEIALKHRWLISPVLARSAFAPNSACGGVPSSEREQIDFWFANQPDANWLLHLGEASGVAALEIELQQARNSLDYLAGSDNSWLHTMRFGAGDRWFVLFEYLAGLRTLAGFPGLRVRRRNSILIPPSRTLSGAQLVYVDPHAPLVLAPDWLRGDANLR